MSRRCSTGQAITFAWVVAIILVIIIASCAFALDNGQWSDVSPSVRDWFNSVRSPNGVPCCSISDGHRTQYDIRPDGYWIPGPMNEHEWIQVPPESVVYNAGNPVGEAIVWWVPYSTNPGGVLIRCFVPGGGV